MFSLLCYFKPFLPARVIAMIACLCVCLCVCVSHAGIVSKRLNVGSRKQHHVIAQGRSFLTPKVVGGRPPSPEICTQSDPFPITLWGT